MYQKKFKIYTVHPWHHHYSGWHYCINYLRDYFHNDDGIICITNGLLDVFNELNLTINKWIAFLHITRSDDKIFLNTIKKYYLENKFNKCEGLFCFSKSSKEFLEQILPSIQIENLIFPTKFTDTVFNWDNYINNKEKKIITIGHWLRKLNSIENIKTNKFEKCILNCSNFKVKLKNVNYLSFLDNNQYDLLLSQNLVFIDLIDSSANNTIVECIVRNTPIIVNRLPSTEEYLGKEYPLLFNDIKEVNKIIDNKNLIMNGYEYLKYMNKDFLKIDYFINQISKTKIYDKI